MTSSYLLILNNSDIDILDHMLSHQSLSAVIPDDRADHIRKYIYPSDRALSLAADLLCVYSLGCFTGDSVTGYNIQRAPGQKPSLSDFPDIDFSYSHTGKAILCSVTDEGRIGADIEYIDPSLDTEDLLYALAPEEHTYIDDFHDSAIIRELLSLWTKKEAYTKCLGTGLSVSPETVNTLLPYISDNMTTRIYGNYVYSVFHTNSKTYTSL